MRFAFDEGAGAVDGIDDPDTRPRQAARIVFGFLRKPAIIGPRFLQSLGKERIHRQIGLADGIALALFPMFGIGLVIGQRQGAGLAHGFA